MTSNVIFVSYQKGYLVLPITAISKAMYKEAVLPFSYDYRDPSTKLSFQMVSPTRLFICDPTFPVIASILNAQWQIIYDSTFTGVGNLKFVASGADATVSTNWKSLNDVLQFYNFAGKLPINSLETVYMKLVTLDDSEYIVGTLFTPSQPYLHLSLTGALPTLTVGVERLIPYNNIIDNVSVDVSDNAQIVPVLSGADAGKVQLAVPGVYLIEASVGVQTAGVATISNPVGVQLSIFLNGSTKVSESFGAIGQFGTGGDGIVQITSLVRVAKTHLINSQKATLEIRVFTPGASGTYQIDNSTSTNFTIYFLG